MRKNRDGSKDVKWERKIKVEVEGRIDSCEETEDRL